MSDAKIILVTHSVEGLGALTVSALAHGGHTVYSGFDSRSRRECVAARHLQKQAAMQGQDIRSLDMRLNSQSSVAAAVAHILSVHGRLDVVVHGGVPALLGPSEAYRPAHVSKAFNRYVFGAHRIMRTVLPHMRQCSDGLVIWILGTAAGGGTLPYVGWYSATQASLEALASQYAREMAPFGIDSAIVMGGMFGSLSSPFQNPTRPTDSSVNQAYEDRLGSDFYRRIESAATNLVRTEEIPGAAAGAVAMIVETPAGERPFRTIIDPMQDGAAIVFPVLDRVRDEMLRRAGFEELLRQPHLARRSDDGVVPVTLLNAAANDDDV